MSDLSNRPVFAEISSLSNKAVAVTQTRKTRLLSGYLYVFSNLLQKPQSQLHLISSVKNLSNFLF